MNRRTFIDSTAAMLALPLPVLLSAQSRTKRDQIFQTALPDLKLENWQVTAVELTFPPGVHTLKHHHPGFVIGYVLEGEFKFQIEGQPQRVYRAGEMFYEPPGAIHLLSESNSQKDGTRVLALVFGEKGKPEATPG